MVTQLVAGRVFDYSRVVGRGAVSGAGFNTPVDMCLAGDDKVYVVDRGDPVQNGLPFSGQQRSGQHGQSGVFGPLDLDLTLERTSAAQEKNFCRTHC